MLKTASSNLKQGIMWNFQRKMIKDQLPPVCRRVSVLSKSNKRFQKRKAAF